MVPRGWSMHTQQRHWFLLWLKVRLAWWSSWKGQRVLCPDTCIPSQAATSSMGRSRSF